MSIDVGVTPNPLYQEGLALKANSADVISSSNAVGLNDILADALSLSQSTTQTVAGPLTIANPITFNHAMFGHVSVLTAAGPYAVAASDRYIIVNQTSNAAITITLPASPTTGRLISVKDGKGNASSFVITITASQNIDAIAGATGLVINNNYGSADLIFSGTQWLIL